MTRIDYYRRYKRYLEKLLKQVDVLIKAEYNKPPYKR